MTSNNRVEAVRAAVAALNAGDIEGYLGIAPQLRKINLQTCEIYAFGGDRVTKVWTYGDPAQLLRQISAAS